MFWSETEFSQRPQKIFQPFTSVDTASSSSYKSLLNNLRESEKQLFKKSFSYNKKRFLANLNSKAILYEDNGPGIEVDLQLY